MSLPRGRIRGFIRRPTPARVAEIATREYMTLTPIEGEQYADVLDGTFAAIDRLDELPVRFPVPRNP